MADPGLLGNCANEKLRFQGPAEISEFSATSLRAVPIDLLADP
jgi:hypothetical protein